MRQKWQKQMALMAHIMDHPQSQELEAISATINDNATIYKRILQDSNKELNKVKIVKRKTGAKGMSAEQVLRAAHLELPLPAAPVAL